jgi:hypothetical protein
MHLYSLIVMILLYRWSCRKFQILWKMCKKFGIDTRTCLFKERRCVMRSRDWPEECISFNGCIVCNPAPFMLFVY